MQRARLAAAAAAMVLAAVTTAGCSSGGDGEGGEDATSNKAAAPVGAHASSLVKELDQVRNTDESRAWAAYSDLAALRALGGGKIPEELRGLAATGWATVNQQDLEARDYLGLDGSKADQALEIGQERGAGRFNGGLDTAAIVAKARKNLEAKEDGKAGPLTMWRLADDDLLQVGQKPIVALSHGTAAFNVLAVDQDTFVRASSRKNAELVSADSKGRTLAREAKFRSVAECLDRPLGALLTDHQMAMGGASPAPGEFTLGSSVIGSSAKELTQVACRTVASSDEAEEVADELRDELAHGKTRLSQLAWTEFFADAKVTAAQAEGGYVVKLTCTSRKSPQVILEMMQSGDLYDLLDPSN